VSKKRGLNQPKEFASHSYLTVPATTCHPIIAGCDQPITAQEDANANTAADMRESVMQAREDAIFARETALNKEQDRNIEREELLCQLQQVNEKLVIAALRSQTVHLQLAREAERTRIAREIHDELGSVLTAIKLHLSATSKNGPGTIETHHLNQSLMGLVDQGIESLRRIINDLRPSILDTMGLWAALEWQSQEFANRTGIKCCFLGQEENYPLEPEQATAIFRICQELLTNTAKHAEATEACVSVKAEKSTFVLRIQDNGKGIDKEQILNLNLNSHGIQGICERVRHFDGSVRFVGKPGKGTTVTVTFPLAVKRQ
jgi:signal transduction histidine kinase